MKILFHVLLIACSVMAFDSSRAESASEQQRRLTPEERYAGYMIVFTDGDLTPTEIETYEAMAESQGRQVRFQASGGFVGGGGGNGVLRGDRIDFLDLVQFDSEFTDTQMNRFEIDLNRKKDPEYFEISLFDNSGLPYENLTVETNLDVSQSEFKNSAPYRFAMNAIGSYGFTLMLALMTSDNITWHFTDESPTNQIRVNTSGIDPSLSLETVAYYYAYPENGRRNDNVVISATRWNKMGFFSQVALIVHEVLRNYQLPYADTARYNFLEIDLQRATAVTTLCQPSDYLSFYLLNILSSYNGTFGGEDGLGEGVTHELARGRACTRLQ